METDSVLEKTLDILLELYDSDPSKFKNHYRSLPLEVYIKIERLSISKSILYKDICNKAKLVALYFHKNI